MTDINVDNSAIRPDANKGKGLAIILSPYFPPSTLACVHRARLLAKHLPTVGWRPIVLCVDEAYHEERLDSGLAALVPNTIEVVRVKAIPAAVTRPLGVGDISLRAKSQLRKAVLRLLATRKIDIVLITGAPYYPMLLAPEIRSRFGVPIVLDFQDPWASARGDRGPLFSKRGISHRLAAWLEPRALRAADFITSVSEIQNAEMVARYRWLDSTRMAAIPIGGDREDFAQVRSAGGALPAGALAAGYRNLSFVGTFVAPFEPAVRTLFRAFRHLRQTRPQVAAAVRLNFIGTSAQPNDQSTYRVQPLAEAEGVADAINEVPRRVPYLEALVTLGCSHGILLVGSDQPHYTASRIFPALMSGRPYLAIYNRSSSAYEILKRAGGGMIFGFGSVKELRHLEIAVADGLATLVTSPEIVGQPDPAAYAPYEGRTIALSYAKIFNALQRAG